MSHVLIEDHSFCDGSLPSFKKIESKKIIEQWLNCKKKSAVAILLIPGDKNKFSNVVLTRRSLAVGSHKGQIGLAGGRFESGDNDPKDTAIRETFEELGIDPEIIKFHADLEPITALDGSMVFPVLLTANIALKNISANIDEVAEVILASWSNFKRVESQPFRFNYFGVWRDSHLFPVGVNKVWGLTAKILHNINFL